MRGIVTLFSFSARVSLLVCLLLILGRVVVFMPEIVYSYVQPPG